LFFGGQGARVARPRVAALADASPPRRVVVPQVMADELDLGLADIALEVTLDDAAHGRRATLGDLPRARLLLLELGVLLADLGEGAVENGEVLLKRELDPVVLLEGGFPRG